MGIRLLVTAVVLTLFIRCSQQIAGGAGGETTNGIVGMVRNSDDTPATGTVVSLFPDGYDPVTGSVLPVNFIDTADTDGNYRFTHIDSGSYTILARHRETASSVLKREIAVVNDSLTTAPVVTLKPSGSITTGFSPDEVSEGEYLYIPGTDIYSQIGTDGSALLSDVPPGTLTVIILASADREKLNILRSGIDVSAGDTSAVELPLWKHSCSIILNTTASGADVSRDVYGFPVLIRLNDDNFDFSQAETDGADLRFTSSDGDSIPYEIEEWSGVDRHAAIWVKVDTVYGNDSTQTLVMYWGNPAASDNSNGAAVFDTAIGFQGVWHMGQTGNTIAFDATANQINGTPIGMKDESLVEGMIGGAQRFDDTTNYILLTGSADGKLNFPQNGTYTLSAWANIEVIDSLAHYIISKSTYSYSLLISKTQRWELYDVEDDVGLQSVYAEPMAQQWELLTGVCDGDDMRLYVDGICIDSVREIKPGLAFDPTYDVHIGKRADSDTYGCWYGMLDEVRLTNVALSADWIKLCYMNQRKDDKLIEFK